MSETADSASPALDDEYDDELLAPPDAIPHPLKDRSLAWVLIVFGAIAFLAAAELSIDDWKLAIDPSFVPSCSINVFVNCSAEMESWQGKLFGFPNPYIGVAVFPILITTGVIMLTGFRAPRWYRALMLSCTTLGIALVVFFVWSTVYRVLRLCPWCMVVWFCMIPIFWYQLVHAIQERLVPLPERLRSSVVRNRSIGTVVLYAALVLWVFAVLHTQILDTL
jgi:uncharacterized membrane protein